MFFRTVFALSLVVASAAIANAHAQSPARTEAKPGMLLFYTPLHRDTAILRALFARADAQNRFASIGWYTLYTGGKGLPSQLELPPGRYGIVWVQAGGKRYTGKLLERKNIISGEGDLYQPLAVFTIRPGEVVDAGHLVLLQGDGRRFRTRIEPTPPEALKLLAEKFPAIYKARITRTMVPLPR
jgi:hypothetical protein